jgi:hypothetical protein
MTLRRVLRTKDVVAKVEDTGHLDTLPATSVMKQFRPGNAELSLYIFFPFLNTHWPSAQCRHELR